jgi:hypothetical protein
MEQVRSDYYVYVYKYTDGTSFYVGKETSLNKGAGNRWHFTNCKKVI